MTQNRLPALKQASRKLLYATLKAPTSATRGLDVNGLIKAVGAGKTSQTMRDSRWYLLKDQVALKSLGYVIEDVRVKIDR